jgi:formylglycine-generating enzyme required for sulfatase activity
MEIATRSIYTAVLLAGFMWATRNNVHADMFGASGNEFTIDFLGVGHEGNSPDPSTGYGAVPYSYRIGSYEIAKDAITKATASGMSNVPSGGGAAGGPASTILWYQAAAFVNWLNTSTGRPAAYNLSFSGSWSMSLWSSGDAWQAGGENLYRHKDAHYFLPSEDEWYKAAYYNPSGSSYFLYPTGSDTAPTVVTSGTTPGTAVYAPDAPDFFIAGAAGVANAGGLSPYGTMGQGGNLWEWCETALDGSNSSPSEERVMRGGGFGDTEEALRSSYRGSGRMVDGNIGLGFRVASVPEPSICALVMIGTGILYAWKRSKHPA